MDFVGNQKAVSFLKKSVSDGNLSHAYLFAGPEHVGKHTLARIFAEAVVSGRGALFDLPQTARNDAGLDIIEIAPEFEEIKGVSKIKNIPVVALREALSMLALYPYSGAKKVLIIDDAHKMTVAAQNALLKTLEEPNPTSIMILVTYEQSGMLDTISSRCQKIVFGLVAEEELLLADEENETVTRLAMGRPGLAVFYARYPEELSKREQMLVDIRKISQASIVDKLRFAEQCGKNVPQALEMLKLWLWELRKCSSDDGSSFPQASYSSAAAIEDAFDALKYTNSNPRLVMERMLLGIGK